MLFKLMGRSDAGLIRVVPPATVTSIVAVGNVLSELIVHGYSEKVVGGVDVGNIYDGWR